MNVSGNGRSGRKWRKRSRIRTGWDVVFTMGDEEINESKGNKTDEHKDVSLAPCPCSSSAFGWLPLLLVCLVWSVSNWEKIGENVEEIVKGAEENGHDS